MDECARIERIVDGWERGGRIEAAELDRIDRHCASCKACGRRFSPLLPFLAREARGVPIGPSDEPSPGFIDGVMERVKGRAPARMRPRLTWALAAAAGVLLVVAIGFAAYRLGTGRGEKELLVHFELAAPEAASVALVGSFTDWETSKLAMSDPDRDGVWEISVTLRKDSIYTYNFLIDGGRWVPDPAAESQVDDGFGGRSSVMTL